MKDTLAYYDSNADAFVESTFQVSMEELYREFLPLLPEGGHILDAGCGSGRDALFFKRNGYRVSAFDGSDAIAALPGRRPVYRFITGFSRMSKNPPHTTAYGPAQVSCICPLMRYLRRLADYGMR